jgi:enterochelin esterase-like enzyme
VVNSTPSAGKLIVRVTALPANHPAGEPVYIAGTMNGWKPGDAAWQLAANCDGSFQVEVPFAKAGDIQQFKFTRGDWKKVELDANRYDVPNRLLNWDGAQTLARYTIAKWADLEGGSLGSPPTVSGDVRFMDVEIASGVMRKLRIYLPADYATATTKRYPVLYMFDGQNLFDKKTAGFGMEWGVDETLEKMFAAGETDGVIVVGIDNEGSGKGRYEEYTNWDWTHPTVGAINARGDEVAAWIVGTVMPRINTDFRTLTDRASTALAGSSMGAYMTLYTGAAYPDKFGKLAAFSLVALDDPMQGQHLRDFLAAPGKTLAGATSVYVDIGDQEKLSYTTSELLVSSHALMCSALQAGGYSPECKLITGGVHDESAWAVRLPGVLKAWFPKAVK